MITNTILMKVNLQLDNCLISLLSHLSKVMLAVWSNKIKSKIKKVFAQYLYKV